MPTHYPLNGGCYTVKEDGTLSTNAEAEAAEASKVLPTSEPKSTEPAPAATKSKGK